MPLKLSRLMATVALGILGILMDFASASADTIGVNGVIDYQSRAVARVNLTGDQGFTFTGAIDAIATINPFNNACGVGCLPGTTISMPGFATGHDVPGIGTLQGITYGVSAFCPFGSTPCVLPHIGVGAGLTTPPFGASKTVVLTVPAGFSGDSWLFADIPSVFHPEELVATATATVTLEEVDFGLGPRWVLDEVRYDLAGTPEPATFVLLATGAAGLGWVARRRRGGSPRTE